MNPPTKRLGRTTYMRPEKTYTDTLTKQDIKEKLINYVKVDDPLHIPLGAHVRYLTKHDGEWKFRLGGQLTKYDARGYVVCSNGQVSWSVQIKDTIFYRKMSEEEITKKYLDLLKEKDDKIDEQDKMIALMAKEIKDLRKQLKIVQEKVSKNIRIDKNKPVKTIKAKAKREATESSSDDLSD